MEFNLIEELTVDIVNSLKIHSTYSGLRRARANKEYLEVPESDNLPKLTYIAIVDQETGEVTQEIHALSIDITRFLMLKSLS